MGPTSAGTDTARATRRAARRRRSGDRRGGGLAAIGVGGPLAAGGLVEAGPPDGGRAPRLGQVEVLDDPLAVYDGVVVRLNGELKIGFIVGIISMIIGYLTLFLVGEMHLLG